MKKLKLDSITGMTFAEGCKCYLDNCRQRNLREDTIRHYKQSYDQFFKYFDPEMPLSSFAEEQYNGYVLYLKEMMDNDVSINSYLRDLITTIHI